MLNKAFLERDALRAEVERLRVENERLRAEHDDLAQWLNIFQNIALERRRQDAKWGEQNHDAFLWLAILGEEFGEAAKAAIEGRIAYMRTELIHVAAVAVAAIESLDRNELRGLPADVPTDEEWYAGKDALWQERHDREADFARRIAD